MGLAHRAGVMADARSALADHPVLDHVAVLVADQRQVVVAVGARSVVHALLRLPEVHVRDRRGAVDRRSHVGVVPRAEGERLRCRDRRARLGVAGHRIVLAEGFGQPEVVLLRVPVLLGEAQVVRPVVHPVVAHEQVRDRRRDVERDARDEGRPGRVAGVAVTGPPRVRPRERVVPGRRHRPELERRRRGLVRPRLRGHRVVPDRRERRRVGERVVIPRVAGREVPRFDVTAGGIAPAERLPDVRADAAPRVAAARPDERARGEGVPPREVRSRSHRVVDDHAAGVRARIEPADVVVRRVEVADPRDVGSCGDSARRLVVEPLRREVAVRRDQGRAVLDQQQDHVVERMSGDCVPVEVPHAGADRERVVGTARGLGAGHLSADRNRVHRGEAFGRVEDRALPGEECAVPAVHDDPVRLVALADVRLVGRDHARAYGRERHRPDALGRAGGGDAKLRPTAARRFGAGDLRDRVTGSGAARGGCEALYRREPGPAVDRRVGRERRGRVRDVPALPRRSGQADRDHAPVDRLEAGEYLTEVDCVAAAEGQPRVADELEARGRREAEQRPVPVQPAPGGRRGGLAADALGEVLAALRQRGGCSELVPRRRGAEPLHGGALGSRGGDRSRPGVVVAQAVTVIGDLRDREGRCRECEGADGRDERDPPEMRTSHVLSPPGSKSMTARSRNRDRAGAIFVRI